MTGSRTAAEDDYRRGFHDGEAGRPQTSDSDSYAAGWRVASIFARDPAEQLTPVPAARTVNLADVMAELPRGLWTPGA
jgi:hypothetical protein